MPKPLLTKRKQKWLGSNRRVNIVRGDPLNPPAAAAARYHAALNSLIDRMTTETERALRRMFRGETAQEFFATDASVASEAKRVTDKLKKKFDSLFNERAEAVAQAAVNAADKASSSSLHSSLQKLSGGMSLPTSTLQGPVMDVVKASVSSNVSLIKSIPQEYLSGVQAAVMRSIQTGNGMEELVPYLQKQGNLTRARAKMIALNETRRAYSSLNKARLTKLNVTSFEWLHTAGSNEPRKLHKELSGKIFRWDDPPVIDEKTGVRGGPGDLINCRCRAVPVIDLGSE